MASDRGAYPVLCILFTNSSILRLPALWSGSDRPTPRSGVGVGDMVGEDPRLELNGESEEVTKVFTEELDICLAIRSLVFIGENSMRALLDLPFLYTQSTATAP